MASSTSKRQYFSRTALEHSVRILNVCNNNDNPTTIRCNNMVYILTANFFYDLDPTIPTKLLLFLLFIHSLKYLWSPITFTPESEKILLSCFNIVKAAFRICH